MSKLTFNAATKEPMQERTLVPEGQYVFQMAKIEMKDNSAKTAQRLNFQAKVLNGEFKGAIVYVGLNWNHPNQVAQDISDREFKSICDAVGKGNDTIQDTDELMGMPFVGTVKHSAPSGEYQEAGETKFKFGPKAEFSKYEVANGHPLLDGVDLAETATTKGETPPWIKKEEEEKKETAKA